MRACTTRSPIRTHPGRCQNLRPHFHPADGLFEYLRCTEPEQTKHVCRFPEPTHVVLPARAYPATVS